MSEPRFLADEDLRHGIVLAVRRLEPLMRIVTVQDVGLRASSDKDVLEFAATHRWLMLSHDVNTMRSMAERRIADGLPVTGLFLIPQSLIVPPSPFTPRQLSPSTRHAPQRYDSSCDCVIRVVIEFPGSGVLCPVVFC